MKKVKWKALYDLLMSDEGCVSIDEAIIEADKKD